ncbi:MAG: hypothetical protein JST54_20710 [Deltaproteobacteria bacterium]|nr:hypothetical protein [Deltaproteobacteria bacterium]
MRVLFASVMAVLCVVVGVMALIHLGVLQPQSLGLNLRGNGLMAQAWELAHRRDAMLLGSVGLVLIFVWGKVAVSVGSKK